VARQSTLFLLTIRVGRITRRVLLTLDNIYTASDHGKPTILVSLDLSAAFDTIDHSQLISRLRTSFGISGTVLDWLSSYLLNRTQVVKMRNTISTSSHLASGVPQGSVLGPILFSGKLAADYKLNHQQYADDTQLFISFSPSNPTPFVSQLETCLLQLHQWLCQNGLCLNPAKSDAIVFGTSKRLATLPEIASLCVAGTDVTLSNNIKTLGVTLDSCLSLNDPCICGLWFVLVSYQGSPSHQGFAYY
jgi:hypothetical protein